MLPNVERSHPAAVFTQKTAAVFFKTARADH